MRRSEGKHCINYHRVLARAVWASRKASQILLLQLIAVFATSGVIVFGLNEPLEQCLTDWAGKYAQARATVATASSNRNLNTITNQRQLKK